MEQSFYQEMLANPDDTLPRLVFADWLEERGDPRGELLRLTHLLTRKTSLPDRAESENRLRLLLARGIKPLGPWYTNSIGMRFAWVSPGVFNMGSPPTEPLRQQDEALHEVEIVHGFYLGLHPVTQDEWVEVMDGNPSRFKGGNRPVECISWEDCQLFCQRLRQRDGLISGFQSPYRLPTEGEWEYACRSGTTSPWFFGPKLLSSQANCNTPPVPTDPVDPNATRLTTTVGKYPGNAWGLKDMHGNIYEWCADYYGPYPSARGVDPSGPEFGSARILRGGSWNSKPERCRSASRAWAAEAYKGSDVGFRVCFRMDYCYAI